MNILFNSIIIFFYIVAPGLTFLKNYYNYELNKSEVVLNIQQKYFVTLLPGFIIHVLFFYLMDSLIDGVEFNFYKAGILIGPESSGDFARVFASIQHNLIWIFAYTVSLIFFAKLLGILLRQGENLLRRRFISIDNMFSGRKKFNIWNELFFVPRSLAFDGEQIYFHLIHVVVEIDGEAVIYKGILERYEVNEKGGDLKCIILRYVEKKAFSSDGGRFEGVEVTSSSNELFLIPYDQIKNMKVNLVVLRTAGEIAGEPLYMQG